MKILQDYHCQNQVAEYATKMIWQLKVKSGILRTLLVINDSRDKFFINRFPAIYFDAAFEFRFIPEKKIIGPWEVHKQDTLKIRLLGGEQLTKEELDKRIDEHNAIVLVNNAKNIIKTSKN